MTRIAIIDGHPDPHHDCYVHALAEAYAEGASSVHEVRTVSVILALHSKLDQLLAANGSRAQPVAAD